MDLPLFQVDAFTDTVFSGNPAAVVLLSRWLPDPVLQAIARENNLAETAYVVPEGDGYRLRWFSPTVEVELCGHATLASAFVLFSRYDRTATRLPFLTRSGELVVTRSGMEAGAPLEMDFPAHPVGEATGDAALLARAEAALGTVPTALYPDGPFALAVLETADEVARLHPDIAAIRALHRYGVIATAPGPEPEPEPSSRAAPVDFVSRMFGPNIGIDEDPVTGSAHCLLAPFWADRLGKTTLAARQISARGGSLTCTVVGDRVRLVGQAVLYLEGRLRLPEAMGGPGL